MTIALPDGLRLSAAPAPDFVRAYAILRRESAA
jgi:hypothetical protein